MLWYTPSRRGAWKKSMKNMDKVLETLILQDYEVVFEVDPLADKFRKIISRPDALVQFPDEGRVSEAGEFIAPDDIHEADRSIFLAETRLDHVLEKMGKNEPFSIRYRRYCGAKDIHYRRISFIPRDDRSAAFVCAIRDETEEVLRQYEKNLDLRLKNEGIRFIVENMCENFMIVNTATHECTTFTNSEGNIVCKNHYEDQINWFADNLVIPEERERYRQYFSMDALMERILNEEGVSSIAFPVDYKGSRHEFAITSTLIDDPSERRKKSRYLFMCAQDITSIRQAEERNRELLVSSQFDPLTRLLNRATAEKNIRQHIPAEPGGSWNTFMILDIDHFKNVNDEYGHMTGDEVLRYMGNSMREVFRSDDILCRWGGDEFVVFIKGFADEKVLTNRLNILRDKMSVFTSKGMSLQINLSIGGVCAPDGTPLNTLYQKADSALYDVKNHGRNGISLLRLS